MGAGGIRGMAIARTSPTFERGRRDGGRRLCAGDTSFPHRLAVATSTVGAGTVKTVSDVAPPDDPDEWTDDQWIEWLKATDERDDDVAGRPTTAARRISQSTPGQMIGQAMMGMAQAIYGKQNDDIVIVVDSAGQPGDDEPFSVHLDPEHPERSSIDFRPDPSVEDPPT